MATSILDRVKKRVETDLDDDEIQKIIDEANTDVINRYGPHPQTASVTEDLNGRKRIITVDHQIDTSQSVAITEYLTEYGWGETPYVMSANDYRIWSDLYSIERRPEGDHSRWHWGDRVQVVYTPVNDGDQREEVIIKLAILGIQYDGSFAGIRSKSVGELHMSQADYQAERDKLMDSLYPRGSLFMA